MAKDWFAQWLMSTAGTVELPSTFYKDVGDGLMVDGEITCDDAIVTFASVGEDGEQTDDEVIAIHFYNLV